MILKLVLSANERKGGRAKKRRVSDKVKTASRMRCLSLVLFFVRPLTGWRNSEKFCRQPVFFLQLASENGFGKIKYCVRPCLTSFHE